MAEKNRENALVKLLLEHLNKNAPRLVVIADARLEEPKREELEFFMNNSLHSVAQSASYNNTNTCFDTCGEWLERRKRSWTEENYSRGRI